MFTTIIVQPIFNLLVLIYALLPGHNFGLSLIIFTIIIRLILWPLVKKQLHQARAMRELQPEMKRIKQAAKGDRQKESVMLMELYKERGINPFGTFPILIIQLIVLIGLYSGLRRVINDPHQLISFAYPSLQHLPWLQSLSHNIHLFDNTLFGVINLSRSALGTAGVYWPAMLIVLGSAVAQYFQAQQLMPKSDDQRSLRQILKSAGEGKQADQAEVNAAVGRSTRFLLPVMIFLFTVQLASALSLYWFTGGLVAYIQQAIVLKRDEKEMETTADKPSKDVSAIPEAEVVKTTPKKKTKKKSTAKTKRRKK
ncbi:MAG TPA: membrane protein insertase YidC [Candidatus Saccharimonadales bacterium]|nr:membrane protein insertase YidC [Candidatus Saccharimonadales bacterium]